MAGEDGQPPGRPPGGQEDGGAGTSGPRTILDTGEGFEADGNKHHWGGRPLHRQL